MWRRKLAAGSSRSGWSGLGCCSVVDFLDVKSCFHWVSRRLCLFVFLGLSFQAPRRELPLQGWGEPARHPSALCPCLGDELPQRRGRRRGCGAPAGIAPNPDPTPGGERGFGHWRLRAALARPGAALSLFHTCVIFMHTHSDRGVHARPRKRKLSGATLLFPANSTVTCRVEGEKQSWDAS